MRTWDRGAGLLALAILLAPGNAARADELLVMPYTCEMVGGRPTLSPGPEQSHRIIGQREQRNFTACSPADPGMCRQWTLHRFDLDCDGARVPWLSVVAAEAEQTEGRARIEDGRLLLRMEPTWSLGEDDRCAQRPGILDGGRMRRYCAERRAMAPPAVVEMPFGFAPMLGIDGFFVKAAPGGGTAPAMPPPVAAAPPPPRIARGEPPQAPRPEAAPPTSKTARTERPQPSEAAPPARTEPPRDAGAKDALAKALPPAAPPAAVQPAPKVAAPAPAPAAPKAPATTPGGPVIPKIINRPDTAADAPQPAPPPAPAPAKAASSSPEAKPAAASPPPPQEDKLPPSQPETAATSQEQSSSITVNLMSVVRSPVTGIALAFAALTAALLTAFALARRRERMNLAGTRPRDIASVSLDGSARRAKPVARLGYTRGTLPPNAAATAMNRVPGQAASGHSGPSDLGDRMPRSKAEALQVLGMGVTPDANATALKKIVDGLRLSWHPDLAKDETDRQLRELRLKQINAAWEIIQGRRGEV
jgi:hypothetical protein